VPYACAGLIGLYSSAVQFHHDGFRVGDPPSDGRPSARMIGRGGGPPLLTGGVARRLRFSVLATGLFLALISACATSDPPSQSRLRVAAFDLTEDQLGGLSIELQTVSEVISIAGEQLARTADYEQLHSTWHEITGEELTIDFSLASRQTELTAGQVRLEVIPDWEWEVQFHLSATDPADTCFGCQGSVAFDLAGENTSRLYVVWGGNSISDPVAY
jgi:hypothetical protein